MTEPKSLRSLAAAALAEAAVLLDGLAVSPDGAAVRNGEHTQVSLLSVPDAQAQVDLLVTCYAAGQPPVDWGQLRVRFQSQGHAETRPAERILRMPLPLDRRGQLATGPLPADSYKAQVYRLAHRVVPSETAALSAPMGEARRGAVLQTLGSVRRVEPAAPPSPTAFTGEGGQLRLQASPREDRLDVTIENPRRELDGRAMELLIALAQSQQVVADAQITLGPTPITCSLRPPPATYYEILYRLLSE